MLFRTVIVIIPFELVCLVNKLISSALCGPLFRVQVVYEILCGRVIRKRNVSYCEKLDTASWQRCCFLTAEYCTVLSYANKRQTLAKPCDHEMGLTLYCATVCCKEAVFRN